MKELLDRKGMLDEKLQAALRGVESDERRNEIKGMRQSTLLAISMEKKKSKKKKAAAPENGMENGAGEDVMES